MPVRRRQRRKPVELPHLSCAPARDRDPAGGGNRHATPAESHTAMPEMRGAAPSRRPVLLPVWQGRDLSNEAKARRGIRVFFQPWREDSDAERAACALKRKGLRPSPMPVQSRTPDAPEEHHDSTRAGARHREASPSGRRRVSVLCARGAGRGAACWIDGRDVGVIAGRPPQPRPLELRGMPV